MGRVSVIYGHYGSGKTNFATNLALLCAKTEKVTVVDLDIVNPYFRTADFSAMFKESGIELCAPQYANTNLDIPALGMDIGRLIKGDNHVIIDVGGDDAGATALGRYAKQFADAADIKVYYVINCYRYLTRTAQETVEILRDIEEAARLKATAIVNNSNLGKDTTPQQVRDALKYAQETSKLAGLPVAYTTARSEIAAQLIDIDGLLPVDIYVKPLWEER